MKEYLVGVKIVDCDGEETRELEIEANSLREAQNKAIDEVKDYDNRVSIEYVKGL